MNIVKENTGDLTFILKVTLIEEDYAPKVKTTLKDYQKKAQIPGFRPGKVPFGMVNKMYGKAVLAEEVNKLFSDSVSNYIVENKIEYIGNPIPSDATQPKVDFENDTEFEFHVEVAEKPTFDINYETLKSEYQNIKADDAFVDKLIQDIQSRNGERIEGETVEENDLVYGDFEELNEEGKALEGGLKKERSIIAVDKIKLKTIKKKFIGKGVGSAFSFEAKKAFENEADFAAFLEIDKEEANKFESKIKFKITEISRIKNAELNEDLFKKIYPDKEIKTEEDLRKQIIEEAELNFLATSDRKFFNEVYKELIETSNFTMPDEFLKRWMKETVDEEETKENSLDEVYEGYRDSLKWQLIETKIMKDNEIMINAEELKMAATEMVLSQFGGMQMTPEMEEYINPIVEKVLKDENQMQQVRGMISEQKLVKVFKEKMNPVQSEITYTDFVAENENNN